MFDLKDRMKRLFGDDWKPEPPTISLSNVIVVDERRDVLVVKYPQRGFNGLFSDEQIEE